MRRRDFLKTVPAVPIAAGSWNDAWAAEFPGKMPPRALFPTPADGAGVGINPPGFAWWRAPGAAAYRLVITGGDARPVYQSGAVPDPVHLPNRTLPPGDYNWDVEALDAAGKVIARRGAWKFTVPAGIPQLAWEEPKAILARIPDARPRYIFLASELPRVRASLSTTRAKAWTQVKALADKSLSTGLPKPPEYHTFDGRVRQRMGYTWYFREFRGYIDRAVGTMSLAYLLSGEERYGLAAKKILLEAVSWGVEGPMSLLSEFGDEPGLSMARYGHRAYDWLYPLFDAREREAVRDNCIARARQILRRLRKADYLYTPGESHNGRLIAYLSEYAVVLKDEAPDAPEWLDYSLRGLTTFYPHWGGVDGGWAEGMSYAIAYNTIYLGALESLRAATGVDLWKRPFFRNIRKYFVYCAAPNGEMKPFGDGADRGGLGGAAVLLRHHGRRFNDPASIWWANQVTQGVESAADPLVALITEDTVKPVPPRDLPQSAVFRGVGWAALPSALDDPARDTFFLFKSSPYGSVSHSHADQNSFAILKGGRALAIPSGYYGPSYGMPHHADWTRQTKANNCVLVDGNGQIVRQETASGRITAFKDTKAMSYVCGDATPAYGGKLTRFLRHVLYLRPGVFLVLDDLAAPAPATWQWLLHSIEKMELDEAKRLVVARRGPASLTVTLAAPQELAFTQTDQFDTQFNEGNPPEYHQKVENQWHFSAATREKAAATRIAAVMVVEAAGEQLRTKALSHPGWAGVSLNGNAEAWVQLTPGAPGPKSVAGLESGRVPVGARSGNQVVVAEPAV